MPSISSVFFFVGVLVLHVSAQRQIPTQLIFPFTSRSVNGSSATGNCTGETRQNDDYQCNNANSSVVYDGIIPTLTGLDGNMWASQLLTINASSAVLVFNFTGTPNFQVRRVEMVMFNCPQWGISLQSVVLITNSDLAQLGAVNPTLSSCDSLVRFCIPNLNITSSQPSVLKLEFSTLEPTDWIHIAEVGFYGNSSTCPPEIFISESTTATTSITEITATTSTTKIITEIPTWLIFPLTSQSVNGSSATGHCAGATRLSDRYQCDDPTSSVVYDGHIPTLTGLDGNMWASQLLTINASSALVFNFTGTPNFQVRRVEMVVFNCPRWGISLQSVILTNSDLTQLGAADPTLSSCNSLVRVCIPNLNIASSQAVLRLEFTAREPTDWIHIAEVRFYDNSDTCPPEIFILEPTTSTTEIAVIPTWLTFPLTSRSVNGSSATGNCTNATEVLSNRYQCFDSTSSVVYDGHIPTLTGLDGNMWASQLLTINASSAVLVSNFTGTPNFQVMRVEMVVFNCPQWGISVQSVVLTESNLTQLGVVNPTLSSCDSLVRVCVPNVSITFSQELRLELATHEHTDWIHIAEVVFYGNSGTCPPEIFIPEPTTTTNSTTEITSTTAINTKNQKVVTSTDNGATVSAGVGAGVAAGIFFLVVAAVVIIIAVAVIYLQSKKGKVWRFNAHNVLNKTDNIYNMDDKVSMEDIEGPEDEKRDMYDVPSHNRSRCIQSPANQEEAYNQLGGIGRNKPLAHGDELHEAYSQLGHSGVSGAGEIRSVSKVDNHPSQSAPAQEYAALNKDTDNHGPPSQPTQPPAQEYAVVNKDSNRRKPPLQPAQPPGQEYSVLY